jgi:RimJ/RimL family protein N-acetyltransferase
VWDSKELRIYTYDVAAARALDAEDVMRKDHLPDVLAYEPAEAWQPHVSQFLRETLANLEAGAHIYTFAEKGRLLHYGWHVERQARSVFPEVRQEIELPPGSAVLADFYTSPHARGRGLYQKSLRQMLRAAASVPGTDHIYISVLADNRASRHVIEKVGFVYRFSLYKRNVAGRTATWTNGPATPQPPEV